MLNISIINGLSEFVDSKRIYRVIKPGHLGSGLFSYIWVTLQSLYEFQNEKYYIDWTKFTPYFDPKTITNTLNVWEYYFEQPDIKTYPPSDEIIQIGAWNSNPISNYCNLSDVSKEKKEKYNFLIKKYLVLLPHIRDKIIKFEEYYNLKNKNILGVHCRGKSAAFDYAFDTSCERYLSEISLIEKDYDLIFVISDEQSYIDIIKKTYKDKVIFYKGFLRETFDIEKQITNIEHGHKLTSPYKRGEEVIIDAYLLSNASFLICPYSNVSTFSHYLNPKMSYIDIDIKHGKVKKQ